MSKYCGSRNYRQVQEALDEDEVEVQRRLSGSIQGGDIDSIVDRAQVTNYQHRPFDKMTYEEQVDWLRKVRENFNL